ncbi:MAG: pilus assembly PilX N-terminal domain-containing protein [Candidatus Omnitrophota bacterium]
MQVDKKTKGVALVTVLVFMLLVTIIAGAALTIMTKQARLAEHQIRRIKGFSAAESAINKAYQSLRYMNVAPGTLAVGQLNNNDWNDVAGSPGVWEWTWDDIPAGEGFEWGVSVDDVTGAVTTLSTKDIQVFYNTTGGDVTVSGLTVPGGGGLAATVNYGF